MTTAYHVTLWRKMPWYKGGELVAVIEGEQAWLERGDEAAMTEALAELIAKHGGREDDIEQYTLQMLDMVTGEEVGKLTRSLADIYAVRSGMREPAQAPGSPGLLEHVSDEVLVRELLRRLTGR